MNGCQRGLLRSGPIQSTEGCCRPGEQGGAGRLAARALGRCQSDMDPTKHCPDSVRKPCIPSRGASPVDSPRCCTHIPTMPFTPHPHTPWLARCVYPQGWQVSAFADTRQCTQKAGLTLWDWEKTHQLDHFALL